MEIALSQSRFPRWPRSLSWGRGIVLLAGIALTLAVPLAVIASSLLQPFSDTWTHLANTVLLDYIGNSLALMMGVTAGTLLLGTSTAWLTACCNFPGRAFFSWALLLPMAIPAYILAYTYTGMLDYTGPVQSLLRSVLGLEIDAYWFPEIRSLGGAIAMLSLVLYPYVYLLVRGAFLEQSRALLEVGRSLGLSPTRIFFRLAIPAVRPALIAGLTLALMETLADYGTVHYFGVSTFTTGIFRTWFSIGELTTAAQLASLLLTFIAVLLIIENISRQRMRFYQRASTTKPVQRLNIRSVHACAAFFWCLLPILLGFLFPAAQLASWLVNTWQQAFNAEFTVLMMNSFGLATQAAICCLVVALLLSFAQRFSSPSASARFWIRLVKLGYAIPGTVIAVGVLIPLAAIDNFVDGSMRSFFGISSGLLLSGTLFAVTFAYAVRFSPLALQSLESGYSRVSPNIDAAARTLGKTPRQVLTQVHLPLLRSSMLVAVLLVFVDVLKELPTTLILRPFNFNTLAVRAYELASDERLADAALPALAIVLVGIVPVILLSRMISQQNDAA